MQLTRGWSDVRPRTLLGHEGDISSTSTAAVIMRRPRVRGEGSNNSPGFSAILDLNAYTVSFKITMQVERACRRTASRTSA